MELELEDIELKFPLELAVEGVPLSSQASTHSKNLWKEQVREAARAKIPGGTWATESPVMVTILYFPDGRMTGDIDNIVKPILDALKQVVYVDDSQVDRIVSQKFESDRAFRIENPTATLAQVLETDPPVVYIRVDNELSSTE